jgi:hypothetical protein
MENGSHRPTGRINLPIIRFLLAVLAVLGGCAVSMAGPVLADDSLNGHYQAVVDGSRADPLGVDPENMGCRDQKVAGWLVDPQPHRPHGLDMWRRQ